MSNQHTDPKNLPWLSRKLLWVENAASVDRLIKGLFVLCAALVIADFFYKKKTYLPIESISGFHAIFAVLVCVAIVLCARIIRPIIRRDETYYAPHDVEAEPYPQADTERVEQEHKNV